MDYFYVGTGAPSGGLNNPYFKVKYTANTFTFGADIHGFSLNKSMIKADKSTLDKNLGTEVDLALSYNMNKFTVIDLGYSAMNDSKSMSFAKGQATTDVVADTFRRNANWVYLMINIRPDFFYAKPVAIKQ